MRTDATIDGKQIICRNATTIGYSSVKLRVGMFFVYREGYTDGSSSTRLARMIGRIAYAPALNGDKGPIKNYILALALADNGAHCYERWINPDDVVETRPAGSGAFAAFFFAEHLPYDANTLRRLNEYGTLSEHYIQNAAQHVQDWTIASAAK